MATLVSLLRAGAGAIAVLLLAVILWPIGLVVGAILLLGNLLTPRRRAVAQPLAPRDTSAASLMILNWNGRDFLARLLPSVDAAISAHGGAHEVIVIDNGSTDDSVAWTRALSGTTSSARV